MTAYPAALCVLLLCGSPSQTEGTVPCPPPVSASQNLETVKRALGDLERPAEVVPSPSPFPSEQGAFEQSTPEAGTDARQGALGPLVPCDGSSRHADDHEPTRALEVNALEVSATVGPDPVRVPAAGDTSLEPAKERTASGVEETEATSVPADLEDPEGVKTFDGAGPSAGGDGPAESDTPSQEAPWAQEDVLSSRTDPGENSQKNGMLGQAAPDRTRATILRSQDRAENHRSEDRSASEAEERPPSKKLEGPYTTDSVGHFAFAEASPARAVERVVGVTSTTLLLLLGFGTLALRLSLGWPRFPPLYLGRRRIGKEPTDP